MSTAPADRLSPAPPPAGALRRAWPLLHPHRRVLAGAMATSLAATVAELAGPVLVGVAVDAVVNGDGDRLGGAVLAYLALTVVLVVVEQGRRRLGARAGEAFLADLRDAVATSLLARPLAFFDRHPAGELVARSTTDVQALSAFVRRGLPGLVDAGLLLVVTAGVLLAASWQLALVTLAYLPGLIAAVSRFRRSSGPAYAHFAQAEAATTAAIGETLAARSLLQGVGATAAWGRRVAEVDQALLAANDAVLRADNRLSVLGFGQQFTFALVVLSGGILVSQGAITVGVVATFALALRQLFGPLDSLSWFYADAQQARANLARVLDLLGAAHPSPTSGGARRDGAAPGGLDVELAGVCYAYDAGPLALAEVDLRIAAGEQVAITGATGSGKSTLAKVAAGLNEATSGRVRLGGRLVAHWDAVELRRAVVLLPQEGHVIGASLADNLRLVPGHHGDADLWAAVDRAGLRAWVERLPDGLATPLADRGANLSAGELQLVSLARAALANPSVLILDEATADVDPATEALVTRALDRVMAGRTVLVIAHRPATAERCDRTVTLAAGRVAGDHPNLKSRSRRPDRPPGDVDRSPCAPLPSRPARRVQ